MALYAFILLLVVLTTSSTYGFNNTILDEMQGLRFEEIGKLKIIKSNKAIKFRINIRTFMESIKNASENFNLVKDMFANDSYTQNKLKNIKMVLDLKEMEFKDTLHGLVKTEHDSHVKKKRDIFGIMTAEDGEKIARDLEIHRNKANELIDVSNDLKSITNSTTKLMNQTIEQIARKTAMMYLLDEKGDIERIVNAITKMLTEKRLNSEIISIDELDLAIKNIKFNKDEALPYHRLIDYYYNLHLNYTIEDNVIEVEINIPIIEKAPRKLYKIVEIPARSEGKLIMTDVIWKYIAENDDETVVFMSLDICYKSQYNETMYYCNTQSPIKNKNASDCLNNALSGKKTIDMNLCKYSAAQPTSLMFIKLNEGEYFYYTPVNETLNVTCEGNTISEILIEKTSGIIQLDPDCIAVTSSYKLITTMKYAATTYKKMNIVRVFFNVDELKENIRKYNTPYVDKFYVESLGLLREMSKPTRNVEKLGNLNFGMFTSGFMPYLTILAALIIVIYVLYGAWRLRANKQKEGPKISKMPVEEPINFIVIKE